MLLRQKNQQLKQKIKAIEETIEYNNKNLIFHLFKLGISLGIFRIISQFRPNYEELYKTVKIPNKKFFERYIKTAQEVGIIRKIGEKFVLDFFSIEFYHPKYQYLIDDLITIYDKIAAMSQYAAINENHPNILLDFNKDSDVWDLILSTDFCRAYREAVRELLELRNENIVLDVGCGSVSPLYFAKAVSPNGEYTGIDISKSLLNIAESRIRKHGIDCANLKKRDIHNIQPKERYDFAICTMVSGYFSNLRRSLINIYDSLLPKGRIIIFDIFEDKFNTSAYNFYNSLNKKFNRGITTKKIIKILEKESLNFKSMLYGKSFLIITKES